MFSIGVEQNFNTKRWYKYYGSLLAPAWRSQADIPQ